MNVFDIIPHIVTLADRDLDALALAIRRERAARRRTAPVVLPEWFTETVEAHKGARVTAGRFHVFAGLGPCSRAQRDMVAKMMRASGRVGERKGGQVVYTL